MTYNCLHSIAKDAHLPTQFFWKNPQGFPSNLIKILSLPQLSHQPPYSFFRRQTPQAASAQRPINPYSMIERLVHALIASRNGAADDMLLQALDLGDVVEQRIALGALIRRATIPGLAGVIERYDSLPQPLKSSILEHLASFGPALSDSGRSLHLPRRLAAMRLIALGRRARLSYVLLENLGAGDEKLQRAAVEALVAISRWVASETRKLQAGQSLQTEDQLKDLFEQRAEIEQAVSKAIDRQKSSFGGSLTRAAILLANHRNSPTLHILRQTRHPGRVPMERRLSQPPASEQVDAWLLASSHIGAGPVRSSFAGTFAHLQDRPVLDVVLRKTHWLKDLDLAAVMSHVMGGRWMDETPLARDLSKRPSTDVPAIATWVAASGCADVVKDILLGRLLDHSRDNVLARLHILRLLTARPLSASVHILKDFLADPDERLRRMATREFARRRPPGYQTLLLSNTAGATKSIIQIIGRSTADGSFRSFWKKFDRMDPAVRRTVGRTVLRLLPDAGKRLTAILHTGTPTDRMRVLQLSRDAGMIEILRGSILQLCVDPDAHVRSKAVTLAGELRPLPEKILIDCIQSDENPRVRANAIEALEEVREARLVPLIAGRLRADNNRERANAIKAVHAMVPEMAVGELREMLEDLRPMHRVSALWALRETQRWERLGDVGRMAKSDMDVNVRRYALGVLKGAAEQIRLPAEEAVA